MTVTQQNWTALSKCWIAKRHNTSAQQHIEINLGAATQLFNSHAWFGNYPHISTIASPSPQRKSFYWYCRYQFSPFLNCHSYTTPIPTPPQVSPVAPFLVAGSVSATTFVVFSAFFAFRVGLLNMESAEEQRARHKGIKRVSAWRSRGCNGCNGGWWRWMDG